MDRLISPARARPSLAFAASMISRNVSACGEPQRLRRARLEDVYPDDGPRGHARAVAAGASLAPMLATAGGIADIAEPDDWAF